MKKILALVFLSVFVIGLASVSMFNHFYADRAMEKDTQQLLYEFHDALLTAQTILKGMPEPEEFNCTPATQELLVKQTFENPAIRLLGVMHGDEQTCTSSDLHEEISSYNTHRLSEEYYLATAFHGDEHKDLLVVREHGGSRYFANIDPFLINHLAEQACSHCLSYQIAIEGDPDIFFSGLKLAGEPYIEMASTRKEGVLDVTLILRASRDFFDYYKEISLFTTSIFALLLAALLTFVAYKLLTVRQSLGRIIRDAIKFSEFVPFYQPIVDSRDGAVLGAEVLVRWKKPNGTIVPPYQFIPFAEESGLIVDITSQLIEKVGADLATLGWNESGQFASVNIVAEHLENEDLFDEISTAISKHNLQPSNLSLEITERKQIPNLAAARKFLDQFYAKGIDLKLDDAGTGYGGFSYIQELGVNTLKIDKMFVDTINSDDVKRSVLDAIIAFADSSNLKTIAEGVEEKDQVAYLAERGVYAIQGYVYAKPMPLSELRTWLSKQPSA